MKKFVKLFTTFLAVLTVLFLASCNSTKYTAQEMADAVSFDYEEKTVTFVIELPKTVERTFENSDKAQVEDIVWSSNDSRVKIDNYYAEFTYDEAQKDQFATINATVKVGKESATNEFRFRIAKESSYEEFMGYKKDVEMAISGYVHYIGEFVPHKTSPEKKAGTASLILLDKTGTKFFYSHQTSMLPSLYQNLKVGQYVGITGKKDIYQGCHQVKGEAQKLPGTDKVSTVAPVELTDANLAIENFVEDNSYAPATATLFVTDAPEDYKGQKRKVEVKALIKDANGTTPVYLCNYDYLFNFDRDNPENNSQALKDVHAALMALQPGDTVNVQGYFATYKGTTAFYVNEAAKLEKVSSNPDYAKVIAQCDKFTDAMKGIKFDVEGEYVLPTSEGVTTTYTLSDTTQQVVTFDATTNKLTVKPTLKETVVTVTAEVSLNNQKITRTFELKVKVPGSKFDEFINSASKDVIENITGVVTTARTKADRKGNLYAYVIIQDANGAYYLRHKVTDDAEMNTYFKVGYNVTINSATVDIFNGLYQLKLNDLTGVTLGEKGTMPAAKELTEEIINDQAKLKNLLSSLVTVTGVVEGGNIKVGNTTFKYYADDKICGTKPAKLVDGTTVTVTGVIAVYNGAYQINPLTADSVVVTPTPAA